MGEVQLNVNQADYNIFLDAMKGAGRWQNLSGGVFDVSTLDSNGYATSVPAGGIGCNTSIWGSGYARNYMLFWDGLDGTVSSAGTLVSGSYVSGCKIDCGGTTTPRGLNVRVMTITGPDYPRNFRLIADNGRDLALYNAGQRYTPEALNILSKSSLLRYMDAMAGASNGGNLNVINWEDRKPASYYSYGNFHWPTNRIVPAANVSYDGTSKFSITWPGQSGALADKTQFIAQMPFLNVTAATSGATTVLTIGTNNLTVGSSVSLASIGGLTGASGVTTVLSKPSSTQIEVNKTSTGTYTSGGTVQGAGLTTTNLNSTGDFRNGSMAAGPGNALTIGWALFTYEAALRCWMVDTTGGSSNTGVSMGMPIEVIADLSNTLNVPPWVISSPYWGDANGESVTNFPSGMATYLKNNLTTAAPLFECGPNETANNGANNIQTGYAYNMQLAHNGAGSDIYGIYNATVGASLTLVIGPHNFVVGSVVVWDNIDQQGLSPKSGTNTVTATTANSITIGVASSGTFAFNSGAGFVAKAAAVTGATSGATTTLTVGTNTFEIGSLVSTAGIGGLTGANGGARVIAKPSSTQITINLTSTGTYTSGGTVTPTTFDVNNWYGLCANNIGAVLASVYGVQNKGVTYRAFAGLLTFIFSAVFPSNTGQDTKLSSPFVTARGLPATYIYMTEAGGANYIAPTYVASSFNMTIVEGQLAYEYTNATAARKTAILNEYVSSTWDSYDPITITGITPGNPTILTVDSTARMRVSDVETITIANVTGNIGTVLNRGAFGANLLYSPSFQTISKTETTITINVDTTGKVYSGGGTVSPGAVAEVNATNLYGNVLPKYALLVNFFGLRFTSYEGGIGPDQMQADSTQSIKGITNGVTTKITVGANSWNMLYNVLGLTGMTTGISSIAAGTLATLLNGNTYTILSADATSITINVDTSAVSSWVSGGSASYVGSQTAANVLRNNLNFCPAAYDVNARALAAFKAVDPSFSTPSEFVLIGTNYGMFSPDFSALSTAYRYQAAKNRFLNKRRMHW